MMKEKKPKRVKVTLKNPTTGEILHGTGLLTKKPGGAKSDTKLWDITLDNGWKMTLPEDEALLWKLQIKKE